MAHVARRNERLRHLHCDENCLSDWCGDRSGNHICDSWVVVRRTGDRGCNCSSNRGKNRRLDLECIDDHCGCGGGMHSLRSLYVFGLDGLSSGDRVLPRLLDLLLRSPVPAIEHSSVFIDRIGCNQSAAAGSTALYRASVTMFCSEASFLAFLAWRIYCAAT